jgi:hypothetical protein
MPRPQQPADDGGLDPTVPAAGSGLTALRCPHPRSGALHRVALRTIQDTDGLVYWVDARNTASTYALSELAPAGHVLEDIRIARAFTAYQHFRLVERVINRVTPRLGCVVVPNLPALYRDDDVPGHEATDMLDAVLDGLATLAATLKTPVLASTTESDRLATTVTDRATREIECTETAFGYRFAGDDVDAHGYWQGGYWQTTIQYWVDLLGPAGTSPAHTMEPPEPVLPVEG